MTVTAHPEQDLAIREMILGVLKSKDKSGQNEIHSSDFRNAITGLGFPMGSSVIENILVFCKIDGRGNLNFSDLEKELVRERRVFNSQKKVEKAPLSTSSGVVSKPWRGDEFHRSKVAAEQQLRKITEHGPQVKDIYHALSHHTLGPREALERLESLEIKPNKEFLKLLQRMAIGEATYAEFVKTLSQNNGTQQDLESQQVVAGSARSKQSDLGEVVGQRKRSTVGMKTAFHESADQEVKTRTIRKMMLENAADQAHTRGAQVKHTLFSDPEPVSLLSHNQQDMVVGSMGAKGLEVSFNVEAKLQREQVLAALRRLDMGAISMDDFQDMLFSIGVDIPESLAVDIRRAAASGRMDVKKYVKLLDATIFKNNAIEQHQTQLEIAVLENRFREALAHQGLDSLLTLAQVFRDFDGDRDGTLTFSEFRAGCVALALNAELNDNELRMLFHSFDKNGDGVLQCEEFLQSVRGSLSASRALWVRRAFQKINRHADDSVLIDVVVESFDPEGHPSVLSGVKSARDVKSEFVRWFTNEHDFDGAVRYPRFEEYFANIGSHILSDDQFISMLKQCWHLTDHAPAPPVLKLKHKADLNELLDAPSAIQSHGDCITWNQEESLLEKQANDQQERKGKKKMMEAINRRHNTDVINWQRHALSTSSSDSAVENEFRDVGVHRISDGNKKNSSSKSLLSWYTGDRPAPSIPSTPATVFFKVPYQEEQPAAGLPFRMHNDKRVSKMLSPEKSSSSFRIPFGVDSIPQPDPLPSPHQPKSLADILREKSSSKKLADFVK